MKKNRTLRVLAIRRRVCTSLVMFFLALLITLYPSAVPNPLGRAVSNSLSMQNPPLQQDIRMGLLQAIQRRATFTRAHRGGVSSPLEGTEADSSDFAASWYTADRIYFVWHQHQDEVIFTALDPSGGIVNPPRLIGHGRWPRVAGDGNRIAVGWLSSDGKSFGVRLKDGNHWKSEILLPGVDGALSFAASGTLYCVTSEGLWKLNGDHFDRIRETNFRQPAIAIDKEGKPHVASVQNGAVFCDERNLGDGDHPSLVAAPDGRLSVSYISKGSLMVRSLKKGQWDTPVAISSNNPYWPTFALDDKGGERLSYIGPADHGPDATWLVRLPGTQPIMLPSLAGNVTAAWLTTAFDLRQPRNYYRRHDLLLTVNDVWTEMFENTVPEGRYFFPLSPYQVFTSPGDPVPNRVAIHSWHMNPGHYASNTGYQLTVRTAWSEHYVFAADEDDAKRSVSSEHINHNQPDLGLFANAANLPVERPRAGLLEIPIMIANLGEADSTPTRLAMYQGDSAELLGSVPVPPIKPGGRSNFMIPLNYDGKMSTVDFRLEGNSDFDASNDSLRLTLWEPLPTSYTGPEPGLPEVPLELKVTVAGEPAAEYNIVDAYAGHLIAKVVGGVQYGPLRSGTYRVAVQPYAFEGQKVLFNQQIEHPAGSSQTVKLDSGIRALFPGWAGKVWRWAVLDPVDLNRTIQWQSGAHPFMALPPGDYQLAVQPDQFGSQRAPWSQNVHVAPGREVDAKFDSGVQIEIPKDLGPLWRWQALKFGKPGELVQWQSGNIRSMLLPAGEYQVATQPTQFDSQRVVWPQKVRVLPGQELTVSLESGVRLEMAKELGPLWHWQLLSYGRPDAIVQWANGDQRAMVVPPGDYQLAVQPTQFDSQRVVWPQKIQVTPGKQVTFQIGSGVRIEMPKELGPLWRWMLAPYGQPDNVMQWTSGDQRVLAVPPGDYQVASQPNQFDSQRVVWPQRVQVPRDQEVTFTLGSGARLEMPKEVGQPWQWQLLGYGQTDKVVQWANGDQHVIVVPPGDYQVALQPTQFDSQRVVWPEKIEIAPGQQVTLKMYTGIRIDHSGSMAGFEYRFLDAKGNTLQWGKNDGTILMPSGTYSLEARLNAWSRWKRIKDEVQVLHGSITQVTIPTLDDSSRR
jgi:hypothetical protein